VPDCLQSGGSRERAPSQIDFLRSNDVPAELIVVRTALLKSPVYVLLVLTKGGTGCLLSECLPSALWCTDFLFVW
jgi:hypothetical protein